MPSKRSVKSGDFNRVVLTDTTPDEVPLIFDNEGFFDYFSGDLSRLGFEEFDDALDAYIVKLDGFGSTVPYKYKINKSGGGFRELGLVHPGKQYKVKKFYETYSDLICHYCSNSPYSIRKPLRESGAFYVKSSFEGLSAYRHTAPPTRYDLDSWAKYCPSFYAYGRYVRLHEFYDSKEFIGLESKFSVLAMRDVISCFPSVYTHSIEWAVKDKKFSKKHTNLKKGFSKEFDSLLRETNDGETSGIIVGPEFSRIFAEIIFQSIDVKAQNEISRRYGWVQGKTYKVCRYVDDVFIFARDEDVADRVAEQYEDALGQYGFSVNKGKSDLEVRPFITDKSRVVHDVNWKFSEFVDKFSDFRGKGGGRSLVPRDVRDFKKLAGGFIRSVKTICSYNGISYAFIGGYIVGAVNERIKLLVNVDEDIKLDVETEERYVAALKCFLYVAFFFYKVSPEVNSSYRISQSIVLVKRFCDSILPKAGESLSLFLFKEIEDFLDSFLEENFSEVDNFINLEAFNVLLAAQEFSSEYQLGRNFIESIFKSTRKLTYYEIVCLIYCFGNKEYVSDYKEWLVTVVDKKFRSNILGKVERDSEISHLFLDCLACPYIGVDIRVGWAKKFLTESGCQAVDDNDVKSWVLGIEDQGWFVSWKDLDLLNALEKKELKRVGY